MMVWALTWLSVFSLLNLASYVGCGWVSFVLGIIVCCFVSSVR